MPYDRGMAFDNEIACNCELKPFEEKAEAYVRLFLKDIEEVFFCLKFRQCGVWIKLNQEEKRRLAEEK